MSKIKINFENKYLKFLAILFLIIGPIVLIILPSDFFDDGQSVCISVLMFDTECYGCGMTRSIMHLIHLEFSEAIEYNKLGLAVFPILFLLWLKLLLSFFKIKILKWL